MRIDRPGNVQLDAKGVAVQARALVPGRDVRQTMSSFDSERAEDLHCIGAGREKAGKLSGAASRKREETGQTGN
jgi:hypothetical protein